MKIPCSLPLLSVFLLIRSLAQAQYTPCSEADCPRYAAYMQAAARAVSKGKYRQALDAYDAAAFAANNCNMDCLKPINEQLGLVFERIEQQRLAAV